ncbi:MAG: hypothetical protein J6U54_18645 [Clostridiales bacterium]|nr:hypothetical protein [Clostridiales bacterium]
MSEYENNEDVKLNENDLDEIIGGISECTNQLTEYLAELKNEGCSDMDALTGTIEGFSIYFSNSGWIAQFISDNASKFNSPNGYDTSNLKKYWVELKSFQPVSDLLYQMANLTLGWIKNAHTIINAKQNADKSDQILNKESFNLMIKDFEEASAYFEKNPDSISCPESNELFYKYFSDKDDLSKISTDLRDVYFKARFNDFMKDISTKDFFKRVFQFYAVEDDIERYRLSIDTANKMTAIDGYVESVKKIENNGEDINTTATLCKTILQQKIEPYPTIPVIIQLGVSINNMVKSLLELSEYCYDLYVKFYEPDDSAPYCFMNKEAVASKAHGYKMNDITEKDSYLSMYQKMVMSFDNFATTFVFCYGKITTKDKKYKSRYC